MDRTRRVLREVLRRAPGSIREIAEAAGISHVSLIQARDGEFQLGPEKVRRIVKTLRSWSTTCADLADRLEDTLDNSKEASDEA